MNIFKIDLTEKAEEEARNLYQIQEKDGELWITYNGFTVIPESMLKGEALETLKMLRELYVKSKNKVNNEA